jgi:hypothetical protein
MTREETIGRYDRIRYNLLNSDDKAEVDVAFDALHDARGFQPIVHLFSSQVQTSVEGEVYRAVQRIGIEVDKERLLQALQDARRFWHEGYAAGRREPPEWVSVDDALPADNEKVLCFTRSGNICVARWSKRQEKFITSGNVNVTHWMPLPKPPEVEG